MQTITYHDTGERESTRLRNADIIRRFRRAMAATEPGEPIGRAELLRRVRKEPPGGYYVAYRHALARIEELRTRPRRAAGRGKRDYWSELAAKVDTELASSPRLNLGQALARVLAWGRPSTDGLSDSYLWRIYLNHLNQHRRDAHHD